MAPDVEQKMVLELISDGRELYYINGQMHVALSDDEIRCQRDPNTGIRLALDQLQAMKESRWIEQVTYKKACMNCPYACYMFGAGFTVPTAWYFSPFRITPVGRKLLAHKLN